MNLKRKEMVKKGISIVLLFVFVTVLMPTSVFANLISTKNATTYSQSRAEGVTVPTTIEDIFDAEYYLMLYPELRSFYGGDYNLLLKHFINYGIKEGRKCSPYLDLSKYMVNNPDLFAVFGNDINAYISHYFTYGITEGRESFVTPSDVILQKLLENKSLDFDLSQFEVLNNSSSVSYDTESYDEEEHRIIVSDTVIAIPWDYVENGYVTLEMIKAHCGDNLILVQNSKNDITFLAGEISSKKAENRESALEVVKSFFGILNFPEDTCYLYCSASFVDSKGNNIYRFESKDIETDTISTKITDAYAALESTGIVGTVIIRTDSNGNVISLSSTSKDTYDVFETEKIYKVGNINKVSISDKRLTNIHLQPDQPLTLELLSYDFEIIGNLEQVFQGGMKDLNSYYKFFGRRNGELNMVLLFADQEQGVDGENYICLCFPIDEKVFYSTEIPGEKSQPYDNLYANVEIEYRDFTDLYGRKVSLPVAKDENGYYFCAPQYKLVLNESGVEGVAALFGNDPFIRGDGLYYIDIDNPDAKSVTIFSSLMESCKIYYEHVGGANELPTMMAIYCYNSDVENAVGEYGSAVSGLRVTSNLGIIKDQIVTAHEIAHSYILSMISPSYNCTGFNASIHEAYADIFGLIIQQKNFTNYIESYAYENEISFDEAYDKVQKIIPLELDDWLKTGILENGEISLSFRASDPSGSNSAFSNKIGDEAFVVDPLYDKYGSHGNSTVLTHIAYEMWKNGVESDYDKLFDIWFDTTYCMTPESTYYDIRNYILESMKEKDYSEDRINQTMGYFEEANITKETQEFIKVPEKYSPERQYTEEYRNSKALATQNEAAKYQSETIVTQVESENLTRCALLPQFDKESEEADDSETILEGQAEVNENGIQDKVTEVNENGIQDRITELTVKEEIKSAESKDEALQIKETEQIEETEPALQTEEAVQDEETEPALQIEEAVQDEETEPALQIEETLQSEETEAIEQTEEAKPSEAVESVEPKDDVRKTA